MNGHQLRCLHDLHFEAHVDVRPEVAVRETTELKKEIARRLADEFGLNHVTLQFECGLCGSKAVV